MIAARYIAVEGPIGVGKTSLARRLAQTLGHELLLEDAASNPFLDRFYHHPRQAALPTQLFFLFQRAQQLQALRQGDLFRAGLVSDFLMEKDPLFARLNLDADELHLYEQTYHHVALDTPSPDLVIYLQAPVEILLDRIERRGVGYERLIEAAYLQRLTEAYAEFFHHYNAAPLLIVNATAIDLVSNDHDYQALLDYLATLRHGRHYLNPLPCAL